MSEMTVYKDCSCPMKKHSPSPLPPPPRATVASPLATYLRKTNAFSLQPMHQPHNHRPASCCAAAASSSCPCAADEEIATCSYCGECATQPLDPFVVVCACKTRSVHASCLYRWLRARPQTGAARFRCEVCGCAYMDGRPEFAAWLLAVGVWVGVKRLWDEAVVAVVGGSAAEGEAGGGRGGMMIDEDHYHAPNCAHVTKDKMSASTSSVTHTIH